MSEIEVVRDRTQISDPDGLIELIQKQISSYGGDSDYVRLKKAVENALKEESRSVFFLWSDYKERIGAFAFANVCSGLESGADYLWINELYVDEMFRKRGVASQILTYIKNWSLENNVVYIACSTGIRNNRARDLYRKNGFDQEQVMWIDKKDF